MTTRALSLLLFAACAGSTTTTQPAPTPSSSAAFFACEKALREASSASTKGADKAKVVELATAAETARDGVHAPSIAEARSIRDGAK